MAKVKKTKKKRAEKYDPKLKITGSFEDVIKVSVNQKSASSPNNDIVFHLPGGSKVTVTPFEPQPKEGERFDFIIQHDNGKNESFIYSPKSTTTTDQLGSIYQNQALQIFLKNHK